ncbi:hypothetical protein AAG906_027264 [Vitis piasezkii]
MLGNTFPRPNLEYLPNCKIGTSPIIYNNNLSVLLGWKPLKCFLNHYTDAELNITQRVVGEELGVLPGMDSVFTLLALERLVGFLGNLGRRNLRKDKYDIIIYDGINTEETLRMIGVTREQGWELLAGPSLLRLVNEAMSLSTRIQSQWENEFKYGTSWSVLLRYARDLLLHPSSSNNNVMEPIKFDPSKKLVTFPCRMVTIGIQDDTKRPYYSWLGKLSDIDMSKHLISYGGRKGNERSKKGKSGGILKEDCYW